MCSVSGTTCVPSVTTQASTVSSTCLRDKMEQAPNSQSSFIIIITCNAPVLKARHPTLLSYSSIVCVCSFISSDGGVLGFFLLLLLVCYTHTHVQFTMYCTCVCIHVNTCTVHVHVHVPVYTCTCIYNVITCIHVYTCVFLLPLYCSSVRCESRMVAHRVRSQGIFPGAVVTRGEDWRWGDQDGEWETNFTALVDTHTHCHTRLYMSIRLSMCAGYIATCTCTVHVHVHV